MAKMDKKWAVICSTAVAAVYAAGYFTTSSQVVAIQASVPSVNIQKPVNDQNQVSGSSGPGSGQPENTPSSTAPSAKVNQTQTKYKDGTYSGMGMNRRGSIGITLTIKKGQITSVQISDFAMHYSESDVVGLPNEVLNIQSAQVNNVTGATYSTEAFQEAVQDALTKAENA